MSLYRQCFNILRSSTIQNGVLVRVNNVRNIKRWVAPTLRELQKRKVKEGPKPLQPRSTYLEWNYDAELYAFGKRLKETFDDDLLRRALTHRSYCIQQEMKQKDAGVESLETIPDNTELAKEGEAIISRYIHSRFEHKYPREVVSAVLEYLTNETMLSHVASYMGLKDIILSADFPAENVTLANTFKALVAALKYSSDEKRAETFVNDLLLVQLNGKELYDLWSLKDPYGYLQNMAETNGYAPIEPRICNGSAKSTILANYQIGIYSNKKLLGIGWGESIEIAKETAALDAIRKLYQKTASNST